MDHRAGVVLPRDVASGDHVDNTRCSVDSIEAQRRDLRPPDRCQPEASVERAGRSLNIVDVER